MKSTLRKILCAMLSLTMAAAVFVSCGKKDDEAEPDTDATETTVPDSTASDEIIYKERFCCELKDVGSVTIKLTEDKAYCEYSLEMSRSGSDVPIQYSGYTCYTEGSYYVDENGNYIIERLAELFQNEYFGVAMGELTGAEDAYTFALEKISDGIYYPSQEFGFEAPFVRLGATEDKFMTFGKYNEYIEQNSTYPTKLVLFYGDGKTGAGEIVEIQEEYFEAPDLSVVGDATFKVTYNDEQYNVSCHIYPEGEEAPYSYFKFDKDFKRLYASTSELSRNITPDMTYNEYFAAYTGEKPLFYYTEYISGEAPRQTAVTNYTVENWDTSVIADGGMMVYKVSYETETAIYQYTDYVYVVDEDNVDKGRALSLKNVSLENYYDGIYYVAKGTELTEVTGDLTSYSGNAITGARLFISNYEPNTAGIQKVELTGADMVGKKIIPVYVYETAAPVLVKVSFPSAEGFVFTGSDVDFEKTMLQFTYCDGSLKEYAMIDYRDKIKCYGGDGRWDFIMTVESVVDDNTYTSTIYANDIVFP